jgi:hypothetical protein
MSKHTILEKLETHSVQSMQPQALPDASATAHLQQAIEREKAHRQSRSHPLDLLEYQPCEQDGALHLVQRWHLLFFARVGNEHMRDLRAALLQESGRDVQLMQYFKRVQAQYREHAAQSAQSHLESVASQPVIAEIRYGGMSLTSGFWLPADMQMGLVLLPTTGAQLAQGDFTLVQHVLPGTSQSLDVLLVTAPPSRTKAELAAQRSQLGDHLELAQEKHHFTFSTPVAAFFGAISVLAAGGAVDFAAGAVSVTIGIVTIGGVPPKPPAEDIVHLQSERVGSLGTAPSSSQLLEMRQHLIAKNP